MAALTVISHGMGQESGALTVRLLTDQIEKLRYAADRLLVIWADTGGEKPETYDYADWVEKFCADNGVTFIRIKPGSRYHTPAWPSVKDRYLQRFELPMKNCRSCTDKGKIVPFYNALDQFIQDEYGIEGGKDGRQKKAITEFARRHGKIKVLIGFNADEQRRIKSSSRPSKEKWARESIEKLYPLSDWGWSRADSQAYLRSVNAPIPLPSACYFCPFSQAHDILWLKKKHPSLFVEMIEIEAKKLKHFADTQPEGKNHGFFGKQTVEEFVAAAEEKHAGKSVEDLEALVNTHGVQITNSY